MRIKLSKQNWRLVGQKMGWLKRAQIETGAGGVTSTGAAEAMGMGKDKITPNALYNGSRAQNRGNVDGGIDYNEADMNDKAKNIRRDQGLLTEVQVRQLKDIDESIDRLARFINVTAFNLTPFQLGGWFGSIKDSNGNRSGPITSESFEEKLKDYSVDLEESFEIGRNKLARHEMHSHNAGIRNITNNYTPAQLQRFEKAAQERRQKLESTKALVRNAFRTYMAGKPQLENTGGLDFDKGNVEL